MSSHSRVLVYAAFDFISIFFSPLWRVVPSLVRYKITKLLMKCQLQLTETIKDFKTLTFLLEHLV